MTARKLLPVLSQHLVASLGEARAVLLQAGQNHLIAVVHDFSAEARDIARAGVVALLRERG